MFFLKKRISEDFEKLPSTLLCLIAGGGVTAAYNQGGAENPVGVSYGQCILQHYRYNLNKF